MGAALTYSRTLHDDEASCVDSGQFVQVGARCGVAVALMAQTGQSEAQSILPRHAPEPC
jgi:hypothetical protein